MHALRFMRESRITTNIGHLSVSRLNTVEFPIPPLDEQRRILDEVDQRLSAVAHLEQELRVQHERGVALRSSILSAAFSGELVPQDPSDEPASVLLERIAVERASANGRKPKAQRMEQGVLL
jgi:type I restriction enzyme S subunit